MKPFDYVQTYFWVVFIVVACVNLVGAWHRGRHARKADPTLIRGYRRMLIGGLVFFNIPWVIMGAGIMLGGMDSVFDYLVPADGIVSGWQVAFYLTLLAEAIGLAAWTGLLGGADVLARQPGWIFRGPENPKWFTPKIIRWSSLIPLLSCMMFLGMIWMQLPKAPAVPGETIYCITGSVWRVFLMAAGVWLVGLATLVVSIVWIRRSGLPRWWAQKSLVTPGFMLVWSIVWLAASGWGFGYQIYRACEVWSVYESGNAA